LRFDEVVSGAKLVRLPSSRFVGKSEIKFSQRTRDPVVRGSALPEDC
jgi:hypothetical protein